MILGRIFVAAAALSFATTLAVDARAQDTRATEAQKRHEELTAQQSLDRLQQTQKSLELAIEQLQRAPEADKDASPPGDATVGAGIAVQSGAIQQAEQALLDVRRAIDELDVPQDQRQNVLDKLDDADSAMRMARQPDAERERKRLQEALQKVQKEIELAQQALPDPPAAGRR